MQRVRSSLAAVPIGRKLSRSSFWWTVSLWLVFPCALIALDSLSQIGIAISKGAHPAIFDLAACIVSVTGILPALYHANVAMEAEGKPTDNLLLVVKALVIWAGGCLFWIYQLLQ